MCTAIWTNTPSMNKNCRSTSASNPSSLKTLSSSSTCTNPRSRKTICSCRSAMTRIWIRWTYSVYTKTKLGSTTTLRTNFTLSIKKIRPKIHFITGMGSESILSYIETQDFLSKSQYFHQFYFYTSVQVCVNLEIIYLSKKACWYFSWPLSHRHNWQWMESKKHPR